MLSVAEFFLGHDQQRLPVLATLRYQRMQADAFAFFRGSAPLYYARLADAPPLPASPVAWLCGDAHIENFGSYRGDNGLVYFDVNDFDEALRGPLLWDVGRLAVSVLLAAARFGLPAAGRQAAVRELLTTYAATLATGKAYWLERATANGVVRQLLKAVARRRARTLLAGRARRRGGWHLRPGPTIMALPTPKQAAVRAAIEAWRLAHPAPPCGPVLDVAQRVAGVGSLGVPRYVVLAEHLRPGKLPVLLDLKRAVPPAAGGLVPAQPMWPAEAQRVVQVQSWQQAVPPALLQAVPLLGHSYVLRALQPVADKLDFDRQELGSAAFRAALPDFARLLAWAHLRAAARLGAAGPDELQAFGAAAASWLGPVQHFAVGTAAIVREDYRAFRRAYRAGTLLPRPGSPVSA